MKDKPYINHHDELLKRLADPKYAVGYLNACLDDEDEGTFLLALHNVARVHGGLGQLARKTDLNREHLFRMLSKKGNPRLHNLRQIAGALGYKFMLRKA